MKIPLLDETHDAGPMLADDAFCAQEKANGIRLLLMRDGGGVRGFTRSRREWKLPDGVRDAALDLPADTLLDGELVGSRFIAFDVQRFGGADVSALPVLTRFAMLASGLPFDAVRCAVGGRAKRALLAAVRAEGGEGVVFKRLADAVSDTREGGVKFKFYRAETFTVEAVDIARGVARVALAGVGESRVAFPFAGKWPRVGDLAEVRFDCVSRNGKLMRPRWLGVRLDLAA